MDMVTLKGGPANGLYVEEWPNMEPMLVRCDNGKWARYVVEHYWCDADECDGDHYARVFDGFYGAPECDLADDLEIRDESEI